MLSGRSSLVSAPDHELTASVREGADQEAVRILYERHWRSVFHYARSCCRSAHTAEDLASEAFARTLEAVRDGNGPESAWRPYLLTVVRRTAAQWAASERRTELSEDFERWCEKHLGLVDAESSEDRMLHHEDRQLVSRGFRSLPERWQAVLWYSEVERQPASTVARLLGLSRSGVSSLNARAREGLREAYLAAHLRLTGGDEECRRYGSLLAASVRKPDAQVKRFLAAHLDSCSTCRRAVRELTDLNERIGAVLPVGILLWGAERLLSGGAAATAVAGSAQPLVPAVPDPTVTGSLPAHGLHWGAGAAAVAVTGVVVAVLASGPPPARSEPPVPRAAAPATLAPAAAPVPTRTEGPRPTEAPTPTAVANAVATAMATAKATPTTSAPTEPPVGAWAPAPRDRTTMRIAATGRCIEIPDASTASGVQPREAGCDGSAAQQWDVLMPYKGDRGRLQLRNTATGLCLRGSGTKEEGAPVVQQACDARDRRQLWWLHSRNGTFGGFFDQDKVMVLGLSDPCAGDPGRPHNPHITTNRDHGNSPSHSIRFDGVLLDDRIPEVSSRRT
ncbi:MULTISPECIES: sigma-70 family RNA polymerase sigma factor [Streptomyces]|uniref:sigma-70 family RNA polymerase sigma factor n=1 Tax=Streptomyces TaxID=1883 RepID=UPI00136B4CB4|nr:sigma-70 family RNA polymerase sigma factor [Streptomyces sp. SID1046]MYV75798.1 sigma-70 family RNA polymerase sigma factor [Streptomyces sp. SID1046]